LDTILDSDTYKEYIELEKPTYEEDKEFFRKIFRTLIQRNEELDDILEDESIFWNDDIEIVQSFVLKTIKQFNKSEGEDQALLPMFNDSEDREYATKLLYETLSNGKEYREQITRHAKNWDFERIAFMDVIIMQVAMAELYSFPSIPIRVTLNEYIDLAKSYSTPKSSTFINGILDAIVTEMKKDKTIFKN
jgi:N utilization substance protein B